MTLKAPFCCILAVSWQNRGGSRGPFSWLHSPPGLPSIWMDNWAAIQIILSQDMGMQDQNLNIYRQICDPLQTKEMEQTLRIWWSPNDDKMMLMLTFGCVWYVLQVGGWRLACMQPQLSCQSTFTCLSCHHHHHHHHNHRNPLLHRLNHYFLQRKGMNSNK